MATKEELVEAVMEEEGGTKAQAARVVDKLFETITRSLKKDGEVRVHGFGSWKVKKRNARTARNPQTGATVKVPARMAVTFKPATALKESVN